MRPWLPALALLAVSACAGTPPPGTAGAAMRSGPQRLALADTPASRRHGAARLLAWEGAGRGCGLSVLDDPVAAQWLMAATYAEGPRDVEAPVTACEPVFRAL